MSDEFIDIIPESPASKIPLPVKPSHKPIDSEDIINYITSFYSGNDVECKPDLLHGLTKSAVEFSIDEYINSQLMLIQKCLIQSNPDRASLIKGYFDSLRKTVSLLKIFDLSVASNQILANNIGYQIANLKRLYKKNK